MCITISFYTKENLNNVLHLYIEYQNSSKTFMEVIGTSSKVVYRLNKICMCLSELITYMYATVPSRYFFS